MEEVFGNPPKTGWAKLAPELLVTDLQASLAFWRGILDFRIAYQRPREKFAYLENEDGIQIMLSQRSGVWETGPLERPFGRGAMFQLYVGRYTELLARVRHAAWPLHAGPREVWRRCGDNEHGQREFFVQDPDGYLLMMAVLLGERAPS
ncbi:MAG: VOC family protein [Proteobacteria bacterium]|nr:VOC family protein [Pseudomonadota bacterium]